MFDTCKPHGNFPCRICGTKHFEGCACNFCRDEPITNEINTTELTTDRSGRTLKDYRRMVWELEKRNDELLEALKAEREAIQRVRKDFDKVGALAELDNWDTRHPRMFEVMVQIKKALEKER